MNPFSISVEKSDFLVNILGTNKFPEEGIIIFGAGSATYNLLYFIQEIYHIKVNCIVSNTPPSPSLDAKISQYNIPFLHPTNIRGSDNLVVVLVSLSHDTIIDQLTSLNINIENIFFPKSEHLIFYTHIFQWYFDRSELILKSKDIDNALSLFEDDVSRNLFLHRLALLSDGLDYQNYIKFIKSYSFLENNVYPNVKNPENYFYFNNDLIDNTYSVYINSGAYTGDSVDQFIKNARGSISKIICIEPNLSNFNALIENLKNHNVSFEFINKAVWSHATHLPFSTSNHISLTSFVDFNDLHKTELVDSMSIDELNLVGQNGLIKFDIEGSEYQALVGCTETLNRNNFDLIISSYHKKDDFIYLPLLLNKICKRYNFHLRLFSSSFLEMVLIAKLK